MIVADTCLVVHLFNETTLTPLAQKIRKKDAAWILPSTWQEKYANVISKLARKESVELNEVLEHFDSVLQELKGSEITVDSRKALKIAVQYKISAYDAYFVSLALDFGIKLITEEKEVLKNCKQIVCSFVDFCTTSGSVRSE